MNGLFRASAVQKDVVLYGKCCADATGSRFCARFIRAYNRICGRATAPPTDSPTSNLLAQINVSLAQADEGRLFNADVQAKSVSSDRIMNRYCLSSSEFRIQAKLSKRTELHLPISDCDA